MKLVKIIGTVLVVVAVIFTAAIFLKPANIASGSKTSRDGVHAYEFRAVRTPGVTNFAVEFMLDGRRVLTVRSLGEALGTRLEKWAGQSAVLLDLQTRNYAYKSGDVLGELALLYDFSTGEIVTFGSEVGIEAASSGGRTLATSRAQFDAAVRRAELR